MFLVSNLSPSPASCSKKIIPFPTTEATLDWNFVRPETLADVHRHWCPESESYAGVDALFTAFDRGWRISGKIRREDYFLNKGRQIVIFHFELIRDGEKVRMPVLSNPRLLSLLEKRAVIVLGN